LYHRHVHDALIHYHDFTTYQAKVNYLFVYKLNHSKNRLLLFFSLWQN